MLFNWNKFHCCIRATIALSLTLAIAAQLCLLPSLSKILYTTDTAIEKLSKFDPLDNSSGGADGLIFTEIHSPFVTHHQEETVYKDSQFTNALLASHSIRSPPVTLPK